MGAFAVHKVISKLNGCFSSKAAAPGRDRYQRSLGLVVHAGRFSNRNRRQARHIVTASQGDNPVHRATSHGKVASTPQAEELLASLDQLDKRIACLCASLAETLEANERDRSAIASLRGQVKLLQLDVEDKQNQLHEFMMLAELAAEDSAAIRMDIDVATSTKDDMMQRLECCQREEHQLDTLMKEQLKLTATVNNQSERPKVAAQQRELSGVVSAATEAKAGGAVVLRGPWSFPVAPPGTTSSSLLDPADVDTRPQREPPTQKQVVFEPVPGMILNLPWNVGGDGGDTSASDFPQFLVLGGNDDESESEGWLDHPMAPGLMFMLGVAGTKDVAARFWKSFSGSIPSAYLPASSVLLTCAVAYAVYNLALAL